MKVELLHLTRVFQRGFKAVDDLSFSFTSGEVVGFVGPNGAGKTTTMRMLATLDVPDSGDILIDGKSILDDPSLAHRAVGFMPDDLPNRSDTTVDEYLEAAKEKHEKMGCICFVNEKMGIYFIEDPDGYWLEVIPVRH